MSDEQCGGMDVELESNAARCRRSASAPARPLVPFGPASAAGDAVASMGKSKSARASPQWGPAQLGERFSVWGGRLTGPRARLETKEISAVAGRVRFVHFSLGLPWAVHALGCALRNSRGACVQGRVWMEIVDAFKAQARAEGAAVAAGEDDKGEGAMGALLDLPDMPDPAAADAIVCLISFQKNEHWIRENDVPCSFERLRSERDLAGVPLVQNPDEDYAAAAAAANGADSQAVSAQDTVHGGYARRWLFPTKECKGAREGTVARAGDSRGKVVVGQLSTFTSAKWLQVYSGDEPPCDWRRASHLQKKGACRLYLDAPMAALMQQLPAA
ncbi:unnamed protein product [Prorocentrum cordatum]|uniref:Uncharacterized protein n=1 Tax=Prorocentrum cordatum TaxID=2364126 RepID=A0ABN9SK62_9DINO|nr:unnamed protein product [Polarella glacialis]